MAVTWEGSKAVTVAQKQREGKVKRREGPSG